MVIYFQLHYSIKEWLTTYLMIISKLSSSQYVDNFIESVLYSHNSICDISDSENEIEHKSSLGAGWAHAAHIRNHRLYTWGHSAYGCLGVGPHMTKTSTPNPVSWFVYIRVEVIQVACGRNHSIALTTNGVSTFLNNKCVRLNVACFRSILGVQIDMVNWEQVGVVKHHIQC